MKFFYFLNRLASSRLTLGLVLLILLALLIWFGGPRLSIDGATPLTSQTSRLVAICALGAVFLSFEVFRRWRLERLNRHILHDIGRSPERILRVVRAEWQGTRRVHAHVRNPTRAYGRPP